MEINKLIDSRVKEHSQVMDAILVDIEALRKTVATLKQQNNVQEMAVQAQKLLALKDRMMFHKAAVLVLKDLQEDINGRKEK